MGDCSNHKKEVAGISDMKELARMTADMHYGTLMEYLHELSKCIDADGEKDYNDKKVKLAAGLQYLGMGLFEAALRAEKVWKISKPFMQ